MERSVADQKVGSAPEILGVDFIDYEKLIDEEEEDDVEYFEEDDDEEDEEVYGHEFSLEEEKARLERMFLRLSRETVFLRVHDVVVNGTSELVIKNELEALKKATTMQEIIQIADTVNARLRNLGLFDSVDITLNSGPPELPGTTNVVIEVVEKKSGLFGDVDIFTKPQARSWSLEGKLKLKNLFGCAEDWDSYFTLGWDQISEVSLALLPRWKGIKTPVEARLSFLQRDWLKLSSYKEQSLGFSLGLMSTLHHDLTYSIAWRTLTDPLQVSSNSITRQLGRSLLSSLKYTFNIDKRNSKMRPTQGYALLLTSHIGGLAPDTSRFLRQEFDAQYAVPLGFNNAAVNFGLSSGVIFPWGSGFMSKPSSISERFFLGGKASPVCALAGPSTLLGFKARGLGPSEPRRPATAAADKPGQDMPETNERDALGGDLAVTAFSDLSFDLPMKMLKEAGIHGHIFACAGNLTKLTENEFRQFTLKKYLESFRSTVGCGIVVPIKRYRVEVNYCYVLKQAAHDRCNTGLQFRFSSL